MKILYMIVLALVTLFTGLYMKMYGPPELLFFLGVGYTLALVQINKVKDA